MALTYTNYGTYAAAVEYFSHRLHETSWTGASVSDREKSLILATTLIDALNFKGVKSSVYLIGEDADSDALAAAEASQVLEFPRGSDTVVPSAIERATYEIAYSLLDGKDPEAELESLMVTGQTYAQVKTTYDRNMIPVDHVVNMIPSSVAWTLLVPFLRDSDSIKLSRVS